MSSSIFVDQMLEHSIGVDGTKMSRDDVYRVLATQRKYFDCDVDHESHYVDGSKEHMLYKINHAMRLDDWVFHPSFLSTEATSNMKRQKPDWQRNFHEELRKALDN